MPEHSDPAKVRQCIEQMRHFGVLQLVLPVARCCGWRVVKARLEPRPRFPHAAHVVETRVLIVSCNKVGVECIVHTAVSVLLLQRILALNAAGARHFGCGGHMPSTVALRASQVAWRPQTVRPVPEQVVRVGDGELGRHRGGASRTAERTVKRGVHWLAPVRARQVAEGVEKARAAVHRPDERRVVKLEKHVVSFGLRVALFVLLRTRHVPRTAQRRF